jgi:hypothetical protein
MSPSQSSVPIGPGQVRSGPSSPPVGGPAYMPYAGPYGAAIAGSKMASQQARSAENIARIQAGTQREGFESQERITGGQQQHEALLSQQAQDARYELAMLEDAQLREDRTLKQSVINEVLEFSRMQHADEFDLQRDFQEAQRDLLGREMILREAAQAFNQLTETEKLEIFGKLIERMITIDPEAGTGPIAAMAEAAELEAQREKELSQVEGAIRNYFDAESAFSLTPADAVSYLNRDTWLRDFQSYLDGDEDMGPEQLAFHLRFGNTLSDALGRYLAVKTDGLNAHEIVAAQRQARDQGLDWDTYVNNISRTSGGYALFSATPLPTSATEREAREGEISNRLRRLRGFDMLSDYDRKIRSRLPRMALPASMTGATP